MMAQLELGNGGCIYCDYDDGFLRVVVMIGYGCDDSGEHAHVVEVGTIANCASHLFANR